MKEITKIIIAAVCWLICVALPITLWGAIWSFAMDHIPQVEAAARVAATVACLIIGGCMTIWAAFLGIAVIGSVLVVSVKR